MEYWIKSNYSFINLSKVERLFAGHATNGGVIRAVSVKGDKYTIGYYESIQKAVAELNRIMTSRDAPEIVRLGQAVDLEERLTKLETILSYAPPFGDFTGGEVYLEGQSSFEERVSEQQVQAVQTDKSDLSDQTGNPI